MHRALVSILGFNLIVWNTACDEDRCDTDQRGLFVDTQPLRMCKGDEVFFVPSAVQFSPSPQQEDAETGAGGTLSSPMGGSDSGGSQSDTPSTVVDSATVQTVKLIVQSSSGWRRDHALIDLVQSTSNCEDNGSPSTIAVQLGPGSGCSDENGILSCTTNSEGAAYFTVDRPDQGTGVAYVCPHLDRNLVEASKAYGPLVIKVAGSLAAEVEVALAKSSLAAESHSCGEACQTIRSVPMRIVLEEGSNEVPLPSGISASVALTNATTKMGLAEDSDGCSDEGGPTSIDIADIRKSNGYVFLCLQSDEREEVDVEIKLEGLTSSKTANDHITIEPLLDLTIRYPASTGSGQNEDALELAYTTCGGVPYPTESVETESELRISHPDLNTSYVVELKGQAIKSVALGSDLAELLSDASAREDITFKLNNQLSCELEIR